MGLEIACYLGANCTRPDKVNVVTTLLRKLSVIFVLLLSPMLSAADAIFVEGTFPGDFTLNTTKDVVQNSGGSLTVAGTTTISANSITMTASNDLQTAVLTAVGHITLVEPNGLQGSFLAGGDVFVDSLISGSALYIDALIADLASLTADTVSFANAQDLMVAQTLNILASTIIFRFSDGSVPNLSALNVGGLDLGNANIVLTSVPATSVPEPGTLALLSIGLLGMAARFRKKA